MAKNKIYLAEFDADSHPYVRKIEQMKSITDKATSKIDSSFKKIGVGIATYFGGRELLTFANDAVQLAAKLQGVKKAFDQISNSGTLEKLRKATRNTVSDLQLMQAAVKGDNFKIPLNLLAKGLEFANKRAIQTGESVDYMVESFITGVARKSIPILDNLGISQLALNEEVNRTGDFYKAIGNIVTKENEKMSGSINTTAEKVAQLNTQIENHKTEIGEKLIPVYEKLLKVTGLVLDNYTNIAKFNPTTGFAFQNNQMSDAEFMKKWNNTIQNSWGNIGGGSPSYMLGGVINDLKNDRNRINAFAPVTGGRPSGGGGGKVNNLAWQWYLGNLSGVDSFGDVTGKKMGNKYDYKPPFIGQMQDQVVPDLNKQFLDIGDSFVNKFSETQNIAGNIANIFNVSADSFVGKLMQAYDVGASILSMVSSISSLAGGGGLFSLLGLAEGGTVINKGGKLSYAPIPKFARGGSYMVPAGYSNDSGLIRVQSGERVDVTPSGQVPMIAKAFSELKNVMMAGNMNSARKGKQPVIVNVMLDGRDVSKRVTGNQNRLGKRGVNLSEL